MDDGEGLPLLLGFREVALRRMAEQRATLVRECRAAAGSGLSQTELAVRMSTSQPAVARLKSGTVDVRASASALERYAAAIGGEITWTLYG